MAELAGEGALTAPVFWQAEKRGRDRADKPEYKVKLSAACCFSNKVQVLSLIHIWICASDSPFLKTEG